MSPPSRPPRRLHLLPNRESTLCFFAHRETNHLTPYSTLRKHIHLGDGNFPTVATPRRSIHGAATYSPEESIRTGPALAPTDDMASTHSPGGCITPAPPDAMAATSPTGGRHTADDDDVPDDDTGRIGTTTTLGLSLILGLASLRSKMKLTGGSLLPSANAWMLSLASLRSPSLRSPADLAPLPQR